LAGSTGGVPARCAHSVPASKYVTKSTASSRARVSVIDDIPRVKSPDCTDGMTLSKAVSRNSGVSPRVRATAFIRSTSNPTISP
jgi:hypothetical protein